MDEYRPGAAPGLTERGRVVKWTDRRYGFIQPTQGGADVFFHVADVVDGTLDFSCGERVEYMRVSDPRGSGQKAVGVRRLGR